MGQVCTFGVNWYLVRQTMSDEERQAARERMEKRAEQRPSGERNKRAGQGQRGRRNGPGKT